MESDRKTWEYDIGTVLRVTLNDTYYLHPRNSFNGSQAELSREPRSNEAGWLGVSVIYGEYAGCRPSVLKLRLEMLADGFGDKKILAIHSSVIRDVTDTFD